jgi:hypothetical protein
VQLHLSFLDIPEPEPETHIWGRLTDRQRAEAPDTITRLLTKTVLGDATNDDIHDNDVTNISTNNSEPAAYNSGSEHQEPNHD